MKNKSRIVALCLMIAMVLAVAGCGGGSSVKRVSGLSPEGVVKAFFDAAKSNEMKEAALYVSPDSVADTRSVANFLSGELQELKNANLLSVRKVAQQGEYAAVVVTLQEQDSFKISVKPVGLSRINGEWYIVDFNRIYEDAKYKALQQLLSKI